MYQWFIVKKSSSILLKKNMFNPLLAFFFCKTAPSQVLKCFSVENQETTPSTFLSKFSCEICLYRAFTLYLTCGAFSLVCVLYLFFYFLLFFIFYRYLPWQTLTIRRIAGEGEGIIIFLVFNLHQLTNFHLVHWDFYDFFLLKLIVITRLIAYKTCFP